MDFKKLHVSFNAPVVLSFAGICLMALLLGLITGEASSVLPQDIH